jgi:uncharacterized protein (DUF849 family)
LTACLNGSRGRRAHPALPVTPAELAADARAAVAAGAGLLHVHPRDRAGRESLVAVDVAAAVRAIRGAVPGVPVGVTTGAWIEPDPATRAALVGGWGPAREDLPDAASVNLSEPGAVEVAEALIALGVGLEPGVWTVADAELLARSGLAGRSVRVLVEPRPDDADGAVRAGEDLMAALDRLGVAVPRLLHGEERGTWPVLAAAVRAGVDVRIGLEDTLAGPDGRAVAGNAALVAAAVALAEGDGRG